MGTYELSVLGLRFSLLQKVGTRPLMSFIASTARCLVAASRATGSLTVSRNFTDNVALKRWAFNASGFNQFGLYHDDCLYENEDMKEALKRVPGHLLDERAFRIQRAVQCSVQKTVLPADQWPTYDEDREKGRYLQPYLEEVIRERTEKENWDKQA